MITSFLYFIIYSKMVKYLIIKDLPDPVGATMIPDFWFDYINYLKLITNYFYHNFNES